MSKTAGDSRMGSLFLSESLRSHLSDLSELTVLVFSDSHRQESPMQRFCERHQDAGLAIHLGDHDSDLEDFAARQRIPFIAVAGNCDGTGSVLPRHLLFDICGLRVLALHGHVHNTKLGMGQLAAFAAQTKIAADLVLFGHTHNQGIWHLKAANKPVCLINPGSCQTLHGLSPASALKISFERPGFSYDFILDLPE